MGYTKVHDKKAELKQMLLELKDILGESYTQQLNKFNSSLNTLFNSQEHSFSEDTDENEREFNQEKLDDLKSKYDKAAFDAGKIQRTLWGDTKISSQKRAEAAKKVREMQTIISEDIYTLSKAEPGESLFDVMDKAAPPLAKIDTDQLDRAGGNLSSRIPVTIRDAKGKEIKGFFTRNSNFDPMATYDEKLQVMEEKYGKEADVFSKLIRNTRAKAEENAREKLKTAATEKEKRKYENFKATDEAVLDFIIQSSKDNEGVLQPDLLHGLMKKVLGAEKVPDISKDYIYEVNAAHNSERPIDSTDFTETDKRFHEFFTTLKDLNLQIGIYHNYMGINSGENIDKRNTAMSVVASMLKVPNLIAEARPAGLMVNGKEITGTFMPNAEGMDVNNPTDEFRRINENNAFTDSNGMKDLADMQVLDYICGNYDRHLGNMMYKFDKSGKFTGVQGIDNDASFGCNIPFDKYGIGNVPPLNHFQYISQSMCDTIMNMKPEVLSTTLHSQGLSPYSIEASCHRLEKLQTHLNRSLHPTEADKRAEAKGDFKPIKVVQDDDFDLISSKKCLQNFQSGLAPKNYFIYPYVSVIKAQGSKRLHKDFVQPIAQEVKAEDAKGLDAHAEEFKKQLDSMKKVDHWYIRSSPEFRNMRTALEGLAAFSDNVKQPPMNLENAKKFAEKIKALESWTKDYLGKKSVETGKSEYADSRLRFARNLSKFVNAKKVEFADRIVNELGTKKHKEKQVQNQATKKTDEPQLGPM